MYHYIKGSENTALTKKWHNDSSTPLSLAQKLMMHAKMVAVWATIVGFWLRKHFHSRQIFKIRQKFLEQEPILFPYFETDALRAAVQYSDFDFE